MGRRPGAGGGGEDRPDRPIVCASAGNFGQGVAYAARASASRPSCSRRVKANRARSQRMRALGAEVIEVGEDFDDGACRVRGVRGRHGGELLVDGEDPWISAGAATLALEVTDAVDAGRLPSPAVVVGSRSATARSSTASGRGCGHAAPGCRVVGVQAEGAPAMTLSWRAGRPIDTDAVTTYADGIASRIAIPRRGRADGRPGRRDADRLRGRAPRGPGRAHRRSWDHRRGRRGGVVGRPARRPRPDGPAVVIVTGSNV